MIVWWTAWARQDFEIATDMGIYRWTTIRVESMAGQEEHGWTRRCEDIVGSVTDNGLGAGMRTLYSKKG